MLLLVHVQRSLLSVGNICGFLKKMFKKNVLEKKTLLFFYRCSYTLCIQTIMNTNKVHVSTRRLFTVGRVYASRSVTPTNSIFHTCITKQCSAPFHKGAALRSTLEGTVWAQSPRASTFLQAF